MLFEMRFRKNVATRRDLLEALVFRKLYSSRTDVTFDKGNQATVFGPLVLVLGFLLSRNQPQDPKTLPWHEGFYISKWFC